MFQLRSTWIPVRDALVTDYSIITFNFPNQSEGSTLPDFNHYEQYCDYLEALLAETGFRSQELVVLGLSVGGELLRTLHLDRGVDFRAMILAGVSAPNGRECFWNQYFQTQYELTKEPDLASFVRFMSFNVFSNEFFHQRPHAINVLLSQYNKLFSDRREALSALAHVPVTSPLNKAVPTEPMRCPTFFITGKHDNIVRASKVQLYAQEIGASFHEVDAGHGFPLEKPQETAQCIRDVMLRLEKDAQEART
jgi:pimeloyl-ACP methyl ester carboxylesterase